MAVGLERVRALSRVPAREQARLKVLYLVAIQPRENRRDATGKIAGWRTILNTPALGDRIAASTVN
jgi:hypothetical protein